MRVTKIVLNLHFLPTGPTPVSLSFICLFVQNILFASGIQTWIVRILGEKQTTKPPKPLPFNLDSLLDGLVE